VKAAVLDSYALLAFLFGERAHDPAFHDELRGSFAMARWAQGMKTSLSWENEAKRQHPLLVPEILEQEGDAAVNRR
jgi:hypothetical protein